MINLVIVAGGKQTRFKELSFFPKVLLPSIDSCSILKELIDKTDCLDISLARWIVINKQYSKQVETYIKVNGIEGKINIIESTNTNGSFNTLSEIKNSLPTSDILFIWSDLSLDNFSNVLHACKDCSHNGILFTNSGQYRYKAVNYLTDDSGTRLLHNIYCSAQLDGNVPGLYFLKDLSLVSNTKFECGDNKDLVDAIALNGIDTFEIYDLQDISTKLIEYRDLDVYRKCIKDGFKENALQTRFFNSLVINPNGQTITKRAIDLDYAHLIKKEIEWYLKYEEFTSKEKRHATPYLHGFSNDSFTMDYLVGYKPLHLVLDTLEKRSEIEKIKDLYCNVFRAVNDISKSSSLEVSFETFKQDLRKEVVTKVIDRCEKIKTLLVNYRKEELKCILENVFLHLTSFASSTLDYDAERNMLKYWFCHGDLNGSNILVNEDSLDVKFVDPRGYFGETKLYGWKPYEYAKLLYCLYGYDDFNTKPQIYKEDWPKLRPSLEYSGFKDETFACDRNYIYYQMLVGVIYIALAGYISQDIMKANIAYDYGMRILKWKLENNNNHLK